jgi:hypothetical protein
MYMYVDICRYMDVHPPKPWYDRCWPRMVMFLPSVHYPRMDVVDIRRNSWDDGDDKGSILHFSYTLVNWIYTRFIVDLWVFYGNR